MSRRGSPPGRRASGRSGSLRFSAGEIRDLVLAWLALGLAFTLFLFRADAFRFAASPGRATFLAVGEGVVRSLVTVGIGFLLHELAHKVVAVRFGQVARFRADYGMLGLAIAAGVAGFLFAAPGAVYHAGTVTERENGLIALAGPVTNLGLAVAFLPLLLAGDAVAAVGQLGVTVNLLLAAFNLLPFGPLDGRQVLAWSPVVFGAVFLPSVGFGLYALLGP